CTLSRYLRTANLVPGEETSFTLMTSIPEGVPAGETTVGKLTISGS
ncbi:MAG: hypothetical protein HY369_02070, partial [Candidatus Aenigmarchaeota archaeon]|nr:hypothetical protein [Candidatus Aenigmarchaeota archaeon]